MVADVCNSLDIREDFNKSMLVDSPGWLTEYLTYIGICHPGDTRRQLPHFKTTFQ